MKASAKAATELLSATLLETELTINPKGSVKLSIDLEKRLLKWQESNRWNRNFTRTLSLLEIKEIKSFIEKADLLQWPESSPKKCLPKKESDCQSIWNVKIFGPENKLLFSHYLHDQTPEYFNRFCDGISHFCRQTFTVSD